MLRETIRVSRINKGLSIKETAIGIGIDASLMSRIERGERLPTETQLNALAEVLGLKKELLIRSWLEEKVFNVLNSHPDLAPEVLKAMESRVEYLSGPNFLKQPAIDLKVSVMLERIDSFRSRWQAIKPPTGLQLQKMQKQFRLSNTFESNRIEGNTLTLQETFLVIQEGLTISGKTLHEHLEALNHLEALEFIGEIVSDKLPLTEYRLRQIHQLILKGIDRQNAGVWRRVPVRISGSSHIPPEPWQLGKLMEDYFVFYEQNSHRLHPVILAAEMHERLVSIHPFKDGNGRTSRLVMNLILLQHGYTLATLKGSTEKRMAYYKALESVHKKSDPTPFYRIICRAAEESLKEHLHLAGDPTPESE